MDISFQHPKHLFNSRWLRRVELFGEGNPETLAANMVAVNTSGQVDQNNDGNEEFETQCETTQTQVAEVVPTQVQKANKYLF